MQGTRVTLDMTTLTIMRALPREVDPVVFHMKAEEADSTSYSSGKEVPRRRAKVRRRVG